MKSITLIFFICLGLKTISFSQDCNASIGFGLNITNYNIVNDTVNYSVKIEKTKGYIEKAWEKGIPISHLNMGMDTIGFWFRTGCGMDTLTFVIKKNDTKEEMIVSVLQIKSDIDYSINLDEFIPGTYCLSWTEIESCVKRLNETKKNECSSIKFRPVLKGTMYNDHNDPEWFYPFQIEVLDIKSFAIN